MGEVRRAARAVVALLRSARGQLDAIYSASLAPAEARRRKAEILPGFKSGYAVLRGQGNGWPGCDRFFAQDLGNAHLAAVGAYYDWLPALLALLAPQGNDLPRFYAAAVDWPRLPPVDRGARLAADRSLSR